MVTSVKVLGKMINSKENVFILDKMVKITMEIGLKI